MVDKPWLFKPGQSGNPTGKRDTELAEMLSPHVRIAVAAILRNLRNPKRSLRAAEILLDRVYGKPAQAVTVDGANAADLTVLHLLAARALHDLAQQQPTLEARVVTDETTEPPDLYAPASE